MLPKFRASGLAAALVAALMCSIHAADNPNISQIVNNSPTQFGIIYSLWHCLATVRAVDRPYNVTEALFHKRPWGPIPEFHFWAEPQVGYYCLGDRPDILRLHATMLRDAGIDFVVVDASNNEFRDARTPDSELGIIKPFELLLAEWSKIRGAPKIVVFAPVTAQGTMFEFMMQLLNSYPILQFIYRGKPLGLATDNAPTFPVDHVKFEALQSQYTMRRFWGLVADRRPPSKWSFLEACTPGFLASRGQAKCEQRMSIVDGAVEEISIAAAYQETYMSRKKTAVPKFRGLTFVRQFETLFHTRGVPIAIIASWNEWMAQRFCLNAANQPSAKDCDAGNDHFSDGAKVFVDAYDEEYSRDIEPSKTPMGSFYYRLMKDCITKYRKGLLCNVADVPIGSP